MFLAGYEPEERKVAQVAAELTPEGADQAMGPAATVERAGKETAVEAVGLRVGGAVAYFTSTPTLPAEVLDAQLAKPG
ncbi:hypothetical protein [Streptomyces sp. JW3]|uniref:hypothetical protein n=1 Tax=Streptomyces sp. JW3 TaxID=3456955 RepID=UPI003FA4263D